MKLQGVEAGRGIAAMLVVLSHAATLTGQAMAHRGGGGVPFGGALAAGAAGVDFFFVLSGFIIHYVHAADIGRPARLGRYVWRRVWRVYPLYWIVLGGLLLLLAASPTALRLERDPMVLLTDLVLWPAPREPVLGPAWTLRHELLFYALFAVLILHRGAGRVVLGLWFAGCVVTAATGWDGVPLVFASHNLEFLAGITVSVLLRRGPAWHPWGVLWAGAAGFVVVLAVDAAGWVAAAGAHPWPPSWWPFRLAYAVTAGLTLYGLAGAERAGGVRVPAVLVTLGGASYAIYLSHIVLLLVLAAGVARVLPAGVPGEVVALLLAGVVAVAGVAFSRGVEQPLLRVGRRVPERMGFRYSGGAVRRQPEPGA